MNELHEPSFLTYKYRIENLRNMINIFDFQLRDHFFNTHNLYVSRCGCVAHKHNKRRCVVTEDRACPSCGRSTRLLVDYRNVIYHGERLRETKQLCTCCAHRHEPPCGRCINCRTYSYENGAPVPPCVINSAFDCTVTCEISCDRHPNKFCERMTEDRYALIEEHVYNTRLPIFNLCFKHAHRHTIDPRHRCFVQTHKCCDEAIPVNEHDTSFVVSVLDERGKRYNEYIVYDPSIWREQSYNHFVSFIRAVISMPEMTKDRYNRFEESNFAISNIKKYKSGKESVVRGSVTGFDTRGIYQTATISCTIPYNTVVLPQRLYDLLVAQNYNTDLVCVKRDPSIKTTCMYVLRPVRNADPQGHTVIIPDSIAKPLNQDCDGDKNCIYAISRVHGEYDRSRSYAHALASMELREAHRHRITLIATSRFSLSETNRMILARDAEQNMARCFETIRRCENQDPG